MESISLVLEIILAIWVSLANWTFTNVTQIDQDFSVDILDWIILCLEQVVGRIAVLEIVEYLAASLTPTH